MTAELNKAPQAVVGAELPPPIIATRHGTPAYTVGQMLDYARAAIAADRAQQAGAAAPSVREFLQQLSQCSGGMVNGNRLASRAKELLAATPQPQGAGMQVASDLLNADELAALRRFDECAQDGEGYDVPKAMMRRLSEIGVVQRLSGAYYHVTEFGMSVLASPAQASAAPAELLAEKWAIYYDNLGEQPYESRFMAAWDLYGSEAQAARLISSYHLPKHYKPVKVLIYAASGAPGQARAAVPTEAMLEAMVEYAEDRGVRMTTVDAKAIFNAALAASPEPATAAVPAECPMCDGHGCTHYPDGEWRGKCAVCKGTGIDQSAAPSAQPVEQPADDARDAASERAYNPNHLLDVLLSKMQLKNDQALARMLEVPPPLISKIRHNRAPVGASLLIRMNNLTGISIRDLRDLMGDRREKYRLSDGAWTEEERAKRLSTKGATDGAVGGAE